MLLEDIFRWCVTFHSDLQGLLLRSPSLTSLSKWRRGCSPFAPGICSAASVATLTAFSCHECEGQPLPRGFPAGSCNAGDPSLVPALGRSPGWGPLRGSGTQPIPSITGHPLDRGALWAAVRGVTESDTTASNSLLPRGWWPFAGVRVPHKGTRDVQPVSSCGPVLSARWGGRRWAPLSRL